jgi:hypothetical protein
MKIKKDIILMVFQHNKKYSRISVFYIAAMVSILSCQNDGRWYPDAEVEISSSVEYFDPASGAKALQITLVIHNTGNTSIATSTLTVQVRTDKREYLQTAGSAARIIPGGKIAVNITVPYLETDEKLAADGISLYSAFFE